MLPEVQQQNTFDATETSQDGVGQAEATRGSVSSFFALSLLTATAFVPACQPDTGHQASVESSPAEDSLTLNPLYTGSSSESTTETNPPTYSSGEVMTTTDSLTTEVFATSGEIPSTTDATTELEGAESSTSTGLTTENNTST